MEDKSSTPAVAPPGTLGMAANPWSPKRLRGAGSDRERSATSQGNIPRGATISGHPLEVERETPVDKEDKSLQYG